LSPDFLKTLHLYLLRQVLATLVMTVLVFTFVLVIGNVIKEILGWLVSGQASLGMVIEAVGLLIPFAIGYALPMGMLTATLLVFGRFSADQELTAARAGGISLVSLSAPILFLSLLLCGVTAWANLDLAPRARAAYKGMAAQFTSQLTAKLASAQLPEGRHIKDLEKQGIIFYLGKNRGGNLEDIEVYLYEPGTNPPSSYLAKRGRIEPVTTGTNQLIVLTLFEVQGVRLEGNQTAVVALDQMQIEFDPAQLSESREKRVALRHLSFLELRAELNEIEASVRQRSTELDSAARKKFVAEQLLELTTPVHLQMQRQLAFSFAPFGFALIGISLGIRAQRKETNVGFALSIVLVMVYYSLILLALSLDKQPHLFPHLLIWLPNFLFQGVGAFLLWRANRGF
jgi:lipopolysaccharide export system permease protein